MRRMLFVLFTLASCASMGIALRAQKGSVTPNGCASEAPPGGGFKCSPHDFSGANGTGTGDPAVTGACTFCHTPHRAIQTRLLWNHTLATHSYSWSDAKSTFGGTQMPTIDTTWSGPTKFCLSCHDGSVAIGDIAWFNEQSFTGAKAIVTTPMFHNADEFQTASATGDLKGNHPVAFPYPYYNSAPSTYNNVTTAATVIATDFAPDPTTYGIRLFNQGVDGVTAGAVPGKTGIECSSCHGVHNEKSSYPFGVQAHPLLRGTLGGNTTGPGANYICMKCHTR